MQKILIEAAELQTLMAGEDVVLVDTRSPEQYAECHIQGAVNIHDIFTYLSTSTGEGLEEMRRHFAHVFGQAGIDQNSTVVFYEQGMDSGYGQSCRGHFMLAYLGVNTSFVLHGGLAAWRQLGGEVSQEAPVVEPKRFELHDSGKDLIVDKKQVLEELNRDRVTLLDVRDVDEWIGESSSPYGRDFAPRKGRLPGAKWLEWYRMMKPTPDGMRIKSPGEVRAECENVGLDKNKPIWLYCFKGARTSNTYVALKQAGFKNVATYFGSWNEWSRDPSLPIETVKY